MTLVESVIAKLRRDAAAVQSPADYIKTAREIREAGELPGIGTVRLGLLSSFSLQFVDPFIRVEGLRRGLRLETYFGGFGQFEQELMGDDSGLVEFEPDALVLVMRPEDLDPDALTRYHASDGDRFGALIENVCGRVSNCIRRFRERSTAPVLVANFAAPAAIPLGPFDANVADSLTYALGKANQQLRDAVGSLANAVIWDYAGLVRARGSGRWTDPRMWALARMAVAPEHQPRLAQHLVRTLCAVLQRPAKCLVVDLDNTLWGGVVGDDGLEGIQLGDDYPGNVFKAFQRSVLSLVDRGILLAVVSKNDLAVAKQVFDEHPEMLIRWSDVAAARINWLPKSQNIRGIAKELNIGSDALVLFDDNPVERAEVQANAPEVNVIDVPPNPYDYTEALLESGFFDQVKLSEEDRRRTQMYQQEAQRRTLAEEVGSVEDFLASLEMSASVGHGDAATLGRIAQLVGKTNQFNLTTRRHSPAELAAMAEDPDQVVAWLRLRDRFGDQGLVVVGVLKKVGEAASIDTLLMSCRVMNRHVEEAFLAYLVEEARALGCVTLEGEYIPTERNALVLDLYPSMGFRMVEESDDGRRRFTLDLVASGVEWPAMIRREPAI